MSSTRSQSCSNNIVVELFTPSMWLVCLVCEYKRLWCKTFKRGFVNIFHRIIYIWSFHTIFQCMVNHKVWDLRDSSSEFHCYFLYINGSLYTLNFFFVYLILIRNRSNPRFKRANAKKTGSILPITPETRPLQC